MDARDEDLVFKSKSLNYIPEIRHISFEFSANNPSNSLVGFGIDLVHLNTSVLKFKAE